MWEEIAHIIHITDMHLFVDRLGTRRSPHEQSLITRFIRGLGNMIPRIAKPLNLSDGLNVHSPLALKYLIPTLQQIINSKGGTPLALVQTGDVEAFGGTELPGPFAPRSWEFPAHDYWESECIKLGLNLTTSRIVNLYGNHDVWPHTLPIFRPQSTLLVEGQLRNRAEFRGPLPDWITLPAGKFTIHFFRLNSVQSGFLANTVALGYLSSDPYYQNIGKLDTILGHVATRASGFSSATNTIRILVMHHPPHFFNSQGLVSDLVEGPLYNTADLLPAFNQHRFHLVIAGHRHALDPKKTPLPITGKQSQPVLPANTIQLVAGTTTQESGNPQYRPSFNVYTLRVNEQLDLMCVEREIYRFLTDADTSYTRVHADSAVCSLSIN